jgi:curved DNA-binding protein CbpA
LQKACHPDIVGESGVEVSAIMNEAYDVLMDDNSRVVYDEKMQVLERMNSKMQGYTGSPLSTKVGQDPYPKNGVPRSVFVNES